jgi:hypothetical protein
MHLCPYIGKWPYVGTYAQPPPSSGFHKIEIEIVPYLHKPQIHPSGMDLEKVNQKFTYTGKQGSFSVWEGTHESIG